MSDQEDDLNCDHPRILRRALQEHNEMVKKFDELEGQTQGWPKSERRFHGGLTDDQVEAIKDAILASIYEDIGRSIVKKVLWTCGAVFAALSAGALAWLTAKGYIQVGPP